VVLHPGGENIRKIVTDVHEYMNKLRAKFPDAAVLFSCQPSRGSGAEETRYVHQIADVIKSITREPVTTVVSSDASSSGKLERFRRGEEPYLVAINKVSEGVDIPRIRGVALCRYMESEMQFRQIVGRALRYTDCEDGTAAMVWMPKFSQMYAFALNMYKESLEGIRDLLCPACGEYPCVCPCNACGKNPCECVPSLLPETTLPRFEVLDAVPEAGGGSVGDDEVREHFIQVAREITAQHIAHRHMNEVQLGHALQCANGHGVESEPRVSPLAELADARHKVHFLMGRVVDRFFGGDWARAWAVLFRSRYGIDFKEAAITWSPPQILGFADVLKGILKEGQL
jgi:hypothetical protein